MFVESKKDFYLKKECESVHTNVYACLLRVKMHFSEIAEKFTGIKHKINETGKS